jgi:Helix-turn-helix
MTITQPVGVGHCSCKAEPYKCSCGDTFGGLTPLKTHLDLLRDDTGTHVELAVPGDRAACRVALGIRPRTAKLRVCSCGSAFADVTALDDHLDESGDDSRHEEMAFDLGTLVRSGIRRIRTERGLSMHAMADLLGVHTSAVCRIESGNRTRSDGAAHPGRLLFFSESTYGNSSASASTAPTGLRSAAGACGAACRARCKAIGYATER